GFTPDVAAELTRALLEGGVAALGAKHTLTPHPTAVPETGTLAPEVGTPAPAPEAAFTAPERPFALPEERPFDVYPFEPPAQPAYAPEAPPVDLLRERAFLTPDMQAAQDAEMARAAREYLVRQRAPVTLEAVQEALAGQPGEPRLAPTSMER